MKQLFDTNAFSPTQDDAAATGQRRHLHALPGLADHDNAESTDRPVQWRLDDETIEIGRRGIARARAALDEIKRSGKAA